MKTRIANIEDINDVKEFLMDSWLMHADMEAGYINRDVIARSEFLQYFTNCFDGSNKSYLILAEDGEKIVGCIKLNIEEIQSFFNVNVVLYIDDIYVVADYRRKGVASLLVKEAETIARERDIKWLKARIYSFNSRAAQTFESQGFKNLYSEYFKIIN